MKSRWAYFIGETHPRHQENASFQHEAPSNCVHSHSSCQIWYDFHANQIKLPFLTQLVHYILQLALFSLELVVGARKNYFQFCFLWGHSINLNRKINANNGINEALKNVSVVLLKVLHYKGKMLVDTLHTDTDRLYNKFILSRGNNSGIVNYSTH